MKAHRRESGFALLMVFLLAACVAILLYTELPRVAFEAERQREMQLVDRGNQFKRAIQVFYTDKVNNPMHRYPASLDELENMNNHRYLRRRYVDPMTGKDEWRLVHINGGMLTDSVTTKMNKGPQSASGGPATPEYISTQAYMDTGAPGGAPVGGVNRALVRRPSDSQQPGDANGQAGGSPGLQGDAGGLSASGAPGQSGIPGQTGIPGIPGGIPGQPGVPGGPTGGQQQAPQPCTVYIGSCTPTTASGPQGGQPGQPGIPGMPGIPGGIQPGNGFIPAGAAMPGFGNPGGAANAQSAAAAMIGSLLTTPRPGGMPTGMPGATIGGGIAGVASKFEAEGIMVINDRTAINEWEYIFDLSKYRAPPNPVGGAIGGQQQPNGANPGAGPQGSGPGAVNPGGPMPGFGGGRGQ